ncbi:hypothetical protein QOZ80_4AG0326860 [Eleusine coracana subsp. coracana]|nr:hypothetical protein QOZ80_4AG0326860 [Eleusine coracana subsp. coracana]
MRRRWDVSAAEPNLPRKSSTCNNAQRRRSRGLVDLPPDLLAEIHCRLGFVDRLNLAMVLDGRLLSTEAPCLVLPGDTAETARLFSLADREAGCSWRLAASPDGVEDAIHHNGRFYSVTYSGIVEAWERHAPTGEYRSTAVGPRLLVGEGVHHDERRKYIAAAPDGRLMVVLKECKRVDSYRQPPPVFKVLVLDERNSGQWVETRDIGDAALFVGVNNSLCVDTNKCCSSSGWIRAGCVYYTDDELGKASLRLEQGQFELRDLGVYSLKDNIVGQVEGLPKHKCWPPPAWLTPCV